MPNRLRVAILYGGKSGEHEISLISACHVLRNLDKTRYQIFPIGMDKNGLCYLNDFDELLNDYPEALPVATSLSKPLDSLLVRGKFALDVDVVFPVVHGPLYEDGCLQGMLELADVAYVGAAVLSSALGMNKDSARRLLMADGINCTRYAVFNATGANDATQFAADCARDFGWPLFVKPCSLGSSVGIHRANNMAELTHAIADARRYDFTVLVEAMVEGREIELAVLENVSPLLPPKVSIAGEIKVHHPDGFYSYAAKYLESEQTELIIPAALDDQLLKRLQETAAFVFQRLKCAGMARVDFFVNEQSGMIYFNEINTLPGFTQISMYPKLWEASGVPYAALLDRLIAMAMERSQSRKNLVTHYQ